MIALHHFFTHNTYCHAAYHSHIPSHNAADLDFPEQTQKRPRAICKGQHGGKSAGGWWSAVVRKFSENCMLEGSWEDPWLRGLA